MKNAIILIGILLINAIGYSQGKLNSEDYGISFEYPEGWRHNKSITDNNVMYNVTDARQKIREMKLTIAFTVVLEEAKFGGDLNVISKAYHKGLKKRVELADSKILSEEIIEISGVKVIDITGTANIPVIKQKTSWRILLFEYEGGYYEISAVTSKKEFKMKSVQKDFDFMFNSIKLY